MTDPPLNILHVISAPAAGGAEIYVKDLSFAMADAGHSVHIGFVSRAGETGGNVDFENRFLEELEHYGVKYFFVAKNARSRPWVAVKRIHSYARTHDIQIYHSHLLYGVAFGIAVNAVKIYTHHNVRLQARPLVFGAFMLLVDQVVGISVLCSEALQSNTHKRVETITNGVDESRFAGLDLAPRVPGRTLRCISVGRICAQKNYGLLLRALETLPCEYRQRLAVRIVGEGNPVDLGELETKLREMGLQGVVELAGSRTNVPELLANADLFLMTSKFEGLPIALIEAATSGLPAIVTDVGGCREVIDTCRNGISVEPDNADAFARAIRSMMDNAAGYAAYSKNALRYSGEYSIRRSREKHLVLYRELLGDEKASND